MLTPIEMLAKKNRLPPRMLLGLLFAILLAGCMAAGPRALLKGKKLLEAGDYADAVEALRTATTLLPANAAAWNYLGVAYQKTQQPDEAAAAYQRALSLDRDLVEAHWNLGNLWLEQNKNEPALAEFTAFTLRRSYSTDGWLKLGAAQLRLGQVVPAESSFSWVLNKLDRGNAEAMNGLGLACLERKRPRDAVQWFAAALQGHPGYATATLNLAVTAQQYLRDDKLALQYYRAYLDLTPRPGNWEDVNAIATGLEQGMVVASVPPPPPAVNPVPVMPPTQPPIQSPTPPETQSPADPRRYQPVTPRPAPYQRTPPVVRSSPVPVTPRRPASPAASPVKNPATSPVPLVAATQPKPVPTTVSVNNPTAEPASGPAPAPKAGFWDKLKPTRWFAPTPVDPKYENTGLTPLPAPDSASGAPATTPVLQPTAPPRQAVATGPEPPSFARYGYLAPARPASGDRAGASGAFTRARVLEQASQWADAMQAYHTAAELDPGWFEAQFNYGVLAYRLGIHRQALSAYETALAIEPDSVDARYNFALALKASGYVPDAVNELKKVLAAHPDEVRAHLALANLYAQKLRDPVRAREHYLKVLDLDPGNPQAADIRYWLSVNSE